VEAMVVEAAMVVAAMLMKASVETTAMAEPAAAMVMGVTVAQAEAAVHIIA